MLKWCTGSGYIFFYFLFFSVLISLFSGLELAVDMSDIEQFSSSADELLVKASQEISEVLFYIISCILCVTCTILKFKIHFEKEFMLIISISAV